jgi:hypothetical protein
LLFSVVFRNTTTAAVFALIVLVLFFFGHYWAASIEQSTAWYYHFNLNRGVWPFLTAMIGFWHDATPSERLGAIFQTGFTGPVVGFQIWSNLALGVLFFLVAWVAFDPCTREEKDSTPARQWLWRRTSRRSRIPAHVIGAKAITWKDFTFLGGGKFGLVLKFLVVAVLVAVCNIFVLESGSKVTSEFEGGTLIWVSLVSTMVWLALEASRIFKDEVRWKTLSSLMTLPISVPELAYRKVAGALIGTLPLLAFFVLGAILVPEKWGDFFDAVFRESTFGVLVVAILQYILFLHLTAFLSLVIKRGALPLAIAIQYLGGSFFLGFVSFFIFAGGVGVASFVIGFICLVLIVILHRAIGYRLVRAAAEE